MVLSVITKLAATPSRLEKEAILLKEKNNVLLKRVCVAALDPFKNYHIRKIPEYKRSPVLEKGLDFALNELVQLTSRDVTGNAAIEFLRKLLSDLNADDAKVIEMIIEKDLRCGVSEKTVNKIWPGLISDYPVMLCSQYDEKAVSKIEYPAMCQLKLDGMRFNAICNHNSVEFRTRNGKHLDLLGELEAEFIQLANGGSFVFDGELLVYTDTKGEVFLPRQTSNGILSKALKGTITKQECKMVGATVWDMIPLEPFGKGFCDTEYAWRFDNLERRVKELKSYRIKMVWSKRVETLAEAQVLFERFLSMGQEGVILKNLSSPWESKRVKHQIKFKGELECDLKIVGWEEGTGKNANRLGALVCESSDGVVRVGVGSGFTDGDRDTIKPSCVGSVVAVKYNARIKDKKTGIDSLFLPIFIEIREDKGFADSSKEIK